MLKFHQYMTHTIVFCLAFILPSLSIYTTLFVFSLSALLSPGLTPHLVSHVIHKSGLVYQKWVSRTRTSDYTQQILCDVITSPGPWYMFLTQILIYASRLVHCFVLEHVLPRQAENRPHCSWRFRLVLWIPSWQCLCLHGLDRSFS